MRARRLRWLLLAASLLLPACGGGGEGEPASTPTPDPNATRTATRTRRPTETPGGPTRTATRTGLPTDTPRPTRTPGPPVTLFVRQGGSDDNPGTTPDEALRSIGAAVDRLTPGSTVFVGRGIYPERININGVAGTAELPVHLVADREGAQTGDPEGEVIVDADGELVALIITNSQWVTVDGFFIRGAAPSSETSAVSVRIRGGSDHVTLQHCIVVGTEPADGIRVDSSSDVLLFDNYVLAADRGIIITGDARGTRVINTTITLTARAGLALRAAGGAAPSDTTVLNSIIQETGSDVAIDAAAGLDGYQGDFNLVFQPGLEDQSAAYSPPTIRGENDRNVDAFFVNLDVGDVHLALDSPAIDAGTSSIGGELVDALLDRTTSPDNLRDRAPVDLGFHYPR